jgi:hypothetical protein
MLIVFEVVSSDSKPVGYPVNQPVVTRLLPRGYKYIRTQHKDDKAL